MVLSLLPIGFVLLFWLTNIIAGRWKKFYRLWSKKKKNKKAISNKLRKQCMCMISFSFSNLASQYDSFFELYFMLLASLLLVYNQRRCHGVQKRASRASPLSHQTHFEERKKCVSSCFRHVFLRCYAHWRDLLYFNFDETFSFKIV
jgi:hypothetical protein